MPEGANALGCHAYTRECYTCTYISFIHVCMRNHFKSDKPWKTKWCQVTRYQQQRGHIHGNFQPPVHGRCLFQFPLWWFSEPSQGPLILARSENMMYSCWICSYSDITSTLFVPKSVSLRLKCSSSTQFSGLISLDNGRNTHSGSMIGSEEVILPVEHSSFMEIHYC